VKSEVSDVKDEEAENKDGLDKATAIRVKEKSEFNSEEKEAIEAISALKSALASLKKKSFMQIPRSQMVGMGLSLQQQLHKHSSVFSDVLSDAQRKTLTSFAQEPDAFLEAISDAPTDGGDIDGILDQMKETFEKNLGASQKEEMANQKTYEELRTAKVAEMKAEKNQIKTKTQEIASVDEKNSEAKEDRIDTSKTLKADEDFFIKLKETCKQNDAEYEERRKTRQLEMEAVAKALSTLTSEDAHDLFTKTFNPSFAQKEATVHSERRLEASTVLSSIARKVESPRLATLAVTVRLDAFTRVKKAIDDMITQLKRENANEIKQKDFCVKEFSKNEEQTDKKKRQNSDIGGKITDLKLTISQFNEDMAGLQAEIKEMQAQLKKAGEDRAKENKEFQATVADQRETQKLLNSALTILKGFYARKASAVLFQGGDLEESSDPGRISNVQVHQGLRELVRGLNERSKPPAFKSYKKNAGSPGVVGMIQQIVRDAKKLEAEAIKSEEDAQKAYDALVKNTNASIKMKGKDLVNKSESKAKAETDLVDLKKDQAATALELEQLAKYKAQLHSSCDFILKNFDVRQTARDEEVQALKQAKAILSGAKFNAFLQHS
jgi:hypothetical protein